MEVGFSLRAEVRMVDPRQPRFGQAITGTALLAGFLLDWPPIIPILAIVLGAAALGGGRTNLYGYLFRLARGGLGLSPPSELEEPWPPRFANAVGAVFLGAASLVVASGFEVAAWVLALAVAALAVLAAATGLCVGCEVYVALRRVATRGRVPGKVTVPVESAREV